MVIKAQALNSNDERIAEVTPSGEFVQLKVLNEANEEVSISLRRDELVSCLTEPEAQAPVAPKRPVQRAISVNWRLV